MDKIFTLNPLLQDIILLIHPVFLYIGYIGLFMPFFILFQKNFYFLNYNYFISLITKTNNFLLLLLTIGIFLGSWWAYYELGWGGWWFWDPVENLALLPWCVLIILLHINKVISQNKSFELIFYIFLAFNFIFSLLNTCFVRAGLFNSVHSFVNSYIFNDFSYFCIGFMVLLIIGYIFQKNYQINYFKSSSLLNIFYILLLLMMFLFLIVLIGTFLPVILSFYREITIGYNFYHSLILSIILPLIFFYLRYLLKISNLFIYKLDIFILYLVSFTIITITNYFFYNFIISSCILLMYYTYLIFKNKNTFMLYSHLLFFLFLILIIINYIFETSRLIYIVPGELLNFLNFSIYFNNLYTYTAYKNISESCEFILFSNDFFSYFYPEHRMYENKISAFKSSIKSNILYDLSIFLTEHELSDKWCIRIKYSPLINCIWLSFIFFIFNIFFFIKKKNRFCKIYW